jgi:trimethylamine--corrinoid protein Co-methyltransferase
VIPRLDLPPAAELDAIHAASLRLLEHVGVVFPDRQAQKLLAEAGAEVHARSGLVKMPPRLVDEALAAAPREILLAGRDPARDVLCDGSRTFLTLDGTGAYTLDHRAGKRRQSTMLDLADAVRVADAAPEISVVWNIVSAADAPPTTQVLDELAVCLRNTGKHVQGEVQRAVEVPFVMDILAAAAPDGRWDPARPFFSIVYCPVPPLQHEPEMISAAVALADEGVPMCIYSMGLAGATSPATIAGAVMQANAEILSSIVLFQLVRPGLPCIYVADTGVLDMRAGIYTAASPESILITQAMVGLARRYELPVMASGLTSDANGFSVMSGSDAGMSALAAMLAEPDLLVGAGMLGGAQMLSLPKILLDCELFKQCARVRAGMTVDDDHLMPDVVAEVGPGGHFLKARQTRQHMRSGEIYVPELMLREPYDSWSVAKRAELERAVTAVEEILAGHLPMPLPVGAGDRIDEVIAAARLELSAR